jgi:hypothetical protein
VHVTSLLDAESPAEQLAVLTRAKQLNPWMQITFDPGHEWAVNPTGAVLGILGLADFVFVNFREFKALRRYRHGQLDAEVARGLLSRCAPGATALVTKRYDLVGVFRLERADGAVEQFRLALPFAADGALEDATGAGDAKCSPTRPASFGCRSPPVRWTQRFSRSSECSHVRVDRGEWLGMTINTGFQFDIVGVGALNLDYIATAATVRRQASAGGVDLVAQLNDVLAGEVPVEWGAERDVSADVIYAALEAADAGSLKVNLGGSAFNAITAIAQTQLGLRLGYVGVAGSMPMPGMSSLRQLQLLGIDDSGVRSHADVLSGICFSFIADGERTRPAPGTSSPPACSR